jgi:hypothetical protein
MVATFTAAAAGVHLVMAWAHSAQGMLEVAFFLAAALVQAVLAAAVMIRPTSRVLVAVVVVHLGLVAVWLTSRTVGVLGPPEPAESWDVVTVAWEIAGTVLAVRLIGSSLRPPPLHPGAWTPVAQVAVILTLMLLVLLPTGGH